MTDFFSRFRLVQSALWIMLPGLIHGEFSAPMEWEADEMISMASKKIDLNKETYRINFNNISIMEYVRFVAKISGYNFIFDENELQFAVTIVSEEPTDLENILSALVQVLRINNLNLIEQDGNYIITKSTAIYQIPEIVSEDTKDKTHTSPIVTRVFRIRNTSVNSVATIIRQMVSQKAQIAISTETSQLIVTDVITNIDQISALLTILDSPHSPLEVEAYLAKHTPVQELSNLAREILAPFAQGAALLLVPQVETNSVFIVSTPSLIEKGMTVLEDLDSPAQSQPLGTPAPTENVYLYPIVNRASEEIIPAIEKIETQLKDSKRPPTRLIAMLETVRYLKDSNSLVFVGDSATYIKVKELLTGIDVSFDQAHQITYLLYAPHNVSTTQLLASIQDFISKLKSSSSAAPQFLQALSSAKFLKENDALIFSGSPDVLKKVQDTLAMLDVVPEHAGSQFLIYPLKNSSPIQIENSLKEFADTLRKSPNPDMTLLRAIGSLAYVPDSHALVFVGARQTLDRLKTILNSFDQDPSSKISFYIYKPTGVNEKQMETALTQLGTRLRDSQVPDSTLVSAIESAKFLPETQSFVFTGTQDALDRLQKMLPSIDAAATKTNLSTFYIYTPTKTSSDDFEKAIKTFTSNLESANNPDTILIKALKTAKYLKQTSSFTFTGTPEAIEQVKKILPTLDIIPPQAKSSFYVYHLKNIEQSHFSNSLSDFVKNLQASPNPDESLISAIKSAHYIKESNSMVFTGDHPALERLSTLLPNLDLQESASTNNQFFVYNPPNREGDVLLKSMKEMAVTLKSSGLANAELIQTIENAKWISSSNSLVFSGDAASINHVKELISNVGGALDAAGKSTFFVYKLQYAPADATITYLKKLAQNFDRSTAPHKALIDAIKQIEAVPETNSLLLTGDAATITELKQLIAQYDVPGSAKQQVHQVGPSTFFVYKLQYVSASQLMTSLRSIATGLDKNSPNNEEIATAIQSMKYVKDTNSILFTGSEEALQKVQEIIAKFDIASAATETAKPPLEQQPSNYSVYTPKYVPGDELIEMLCDFEQNLHLSGVNDPALFSTIGNLRWMASTCSLIVSGDTKAINKVLDLLKQFDSPSPEQSMIGEKHELSETSFLVYKLQYHQGDDIRYALRKVAESLIDTHKGQKLPIAEAIDAVQWIPVTNSLLTSGPPEVLSKIRELVQNLDIPLRQVFIEVLIINTSLTNNQSFGLTWSGRGQYKNQAIGQMANIQPTSNTTNTLLPSYTPVNATTYPNFNTGPFPTLGGFDLGVIGDIILHKGKSFLSLGSLISALQTDNDSIVVTNPKMIAQDSNNATVFFGQNVPFTGSTINIQGAGSSQSQNLEYRNVGNNISITPTLGNTDIITLDINTNLSQIIATPTGVPSTTFGITTNQASLSTRVLVPDGSFVCLTAQINDSKTHNRYQIPCLGGLPLIGAAFSEVDRTAQRTNVIIFLRPQIIKTFDDYKRISHNQEDLFRDRAGLPVVREEFDEGIDWVKPPENE